MSEWLDVERADEFERGGVRRIDLEDGTQIAVFNVEGRYFAIEDMCSHEAEILSDGDVEGEEIVCPRHGARFSLVTGAALSAPACEPVAVFEVRIDNGWVQVRAER